VPAVGGGAMVIPAPEILKATGKPRFSGFILFKRNNFARNVTIVIAKIMLAKY
jgi:hypothetical protein